MVTITCVPAEGVVSRAMHPAGSSQDASPKGAGVYRHHPHRQHHGGPGGGHRSVGARIGRRHMHHHHHRRFHHGPYGFGVAHRHGHHGDFGQQHPGGGRMMFHGSPHHRGPRGRHGGFFRAGGLQDIPPHGHGPHRRGRRMHRSLSPHHLMHDGSGGEGGAPLRGHRGEHGGAMMGSDDHLCHFCGRDFFHNFGHDDLFPGTPHRHAAPQQQQQQQQQAPVMAIEQGIEQFGQLSLTS